MVRDDRRELTVGSGVHGVLVIVAATAVLAVVGGLLALVMATFVAPG